MSGRRDSPQSGLDEVLVGLDEAEALAKFDEIDLLCGAQRISPEKRDDAFRQVMAPSHHIALERLFVIVAPGVSDDLADAEERLQGMKAGDAPRTLGDDELVSYLKTAAVAFPLRPILLANEKNPSSAFADEGFPFYLPIKGIKLRAWQ